MNYNDPRFMNMAGLAEAGMSLAVIVHEIRQPLAGLRLALQIAQSNSKTGESPIKVIDEALKFLERASNVTERTREFLLDNESSNERVELRSILSNVVEMMEWRIRAGMRFKLTCDFDSSDASVVGDSVALEHLFVNIIGNGVEAVNDKLQGEVLITTKDSENGAYVLIADNGGGIPSEIEETLFKPFFTTKSKDNGTGLGLFISENIANRHSAKIDLLDDEAMNELNIGRFDTCFKISFPNSSLEKKIG